MTFAGEQFEFGKSEDVIFPERGFDEKAGVIDAKVGFRIAALTAGMEDTDAAFAGNADLAETIAALGGGFVIGEVGSGGWFGS